MAEEILHVKQTEEEAMDKQQNQLRDILDSNRRNDPNVIERLKQKRGRKKSLDQEDKRILLS